jgi:hypothetical protein
MAGKTTMDNTVQEEVEYIKIGGTTYELVSRYIGDVPLLELLKNAIRRDAESLLSGDEKPYI